MKKIVLVALIMWLVLPFTLAETPKTIDDYMALYNAWTLTNDTLDKENCYYSEVEEGVYLYLWDDDNQNNLAIMPFNFSAIMSCQCSSKGDIGKFFKQATSLVLMITHGDNGGINELYSYLLSNYFNLAPNEQGDYIDCWLKDYSCSYMYTMQLSNDKTYTFTVMASYNPY